MRLLKRQTELGEFHEDFPSSHGPVTGYRALSDEQHRKIPQEGLRGTANIPHPFDFDVVWAYMGHDEEGRKKAREQAQYWSDVMSEQRDTPGQVVGIRGSNIDLPERSKDYAMHDDSGNYPWKDDNWASYGPYAIPQDIPPEQVVSRRNPN